MSSLATDLASLYSTEHSRLMRLLVQRGVSAAAAADLVQETFVRMLRAPANEVRDPKSYLFKAAANIAIDEHRRVQRAGTIFDPATELDASVPDASPLPDALLMSKEGLEELERAVLELPPRCREVLLLHKFEGLSYAEIADRLDISKNTVMVHMAKAIRTLRRQLHENSSSTR